MTISILKKNAKEDRVQIQFSAPQSLAKDLKEVRDLAERCGVAIDISPALVTTLRRLVEKAKKELLERDRAKLATLLHADQTLVQTPNSLAVENDLQYGSTQN